ncbi:MAG: bifunctional nuclease family protein [Deltaproteobacteria bacterium]|nr:bifunctional nuclease family protein [Deltaproteobacteria bacterium]
MRRNILLVVLSVLCSYPLWLEASQEGTVVEMKVKRVMLDPSTKTPTAVVILESTKEKKLIPIWIGNEEATSIAIQLENVAIPRPNSHDLIRNILQGVGVALHRITITDIRNNTYYAVITLKLKGQEFQIDSRPSDAIAVALRMKAPIYATAQVVAKARELPGSAMPREDLRKILGIHVQDLTSDLASLFDLTVKQGVLVADIELGSAASEAGIQRGDLILKVNDRSVQKVADLESFFRSVKKPVQVKMEVLRKGKTATVVFDLPS